MDKKNDNWKAFTLTFDDHYNDALRQQHHAVQFIALVGRHLIPQKPDDSNTNMQYFPEREMLLGNELSNQYRIGLKLSTLELFLLDKELNQIRHISLVGKTRIQVFEELKNVLSESDIDISNLKDELHYDIPAHSVASGAAFTTENSIYFKENVLHFHNSKTVLEAIVADYKDAAAVRVWPHHFDTGTFIPLSFNISGEITRYIGLGFAIPDSMVDEPYCYISFWSADSTENINTLSPLEIGEWKIPDWNGAVLKLSEIRNNNSARSQYEMVYQFFKSGLDIITRYFN
jgi:hypothetical protein